MLVGYELILLRGWYKLLQVPVRVGVLRKLELLQIEESPISNLTMGGEYLPEADYSLGVCMDWGQETVSVCPRAKQYT